MLRGYVDESYDAKSSIPSVFALGCIIADDSTWRYFEWDWRDCIDGVNRELRAAGRPEITRYHAADCSSREGDFNGWSIDEQRSFVGSLFQVFKKHRLDLIGVSVNLSHLVDEIPEISPNPIGFAYVLFVQVLMSEIGSFTLSRHPGSVIGLFHDHCRYNAAIQDAFDHLLSDPVFQYSGAFTSIAPMRWQHCVPLQPADLIAYEHFKEGERHLPGISRRRRKSLEMLLDLQSLGMRGIGFDAKTIGALKNAFRNLDPKTKATLLESARIPEGKAAGV